MMEEENFLEKISSLRDMAILQGGYLTEEQVGEEFPALTREQKEALLRYFREQNIGIGEKLPDEEILSEEDGKMIRLYMEELEELAEADEALKRSLVMAALNGDLNAKEELTRSYLRSVVDMAKLYSGQGVEAADLIGEGNVALTAAMNMLGSIEDPSECDEMVARSVMNAMEELIRSENAETEKQERTMALVLKVLGKVKSLSDELRRKLTLEEALEETGMSEDELRRAVSLSKDLLEYVAL
ncbi:MAG: hypothetical protein K6E50_10680 [Lachnospiraceae bacterium]|nr:hypothetical protein [Lachnospiraceae bacterium]